MNSLKLLAFSDRPARIDINKLVYEESVDLIVTLGDLTREDLLPLERIVDIPKIGVYGNHCSGTYMPELGITNLHTKQFEYNGWIFGGFEGCVRYKESKYAPMYTQQEALDLMVGFPYVDVFISHCPPRGINDEPDEIAHTGFDALRSYLDTMHPQYWMHGHTYPSESSLVSQVGSTTIEYVFGYKVITVNKHA